MKNYILTEDEVEAIHAGLDLLSELVEYDESENDKDTAEQALDTIRAVRERSSASVAEVAGRTTGAQMRAAWVRR